MSVRSGQSITTLFTTRRIDTGAAANADSTPAGTLYVNGVSNAASVTVANLTTGVYTAAVTLPTLAIGDVVDLRIAATVNSVSDNAVIWRDTKDVLLDASGKTTDSVQTGDSFARIGATGSSLTSLAQASVCTEVRLAKLASLTFTVAGQLDSNVQYVNDVQITGVGSSGDPWGPV